MIAVFESARGNHRRPRIKQRPLIPCAISDSSETRIVEVEMVDVVLDIPTYAFRLLNTSNSFDLHLGSTNVVSEADVTRRAALWNRPHSFSGGGRVPASKSLSRQMLGLGLDITVRVRFEKKHWPYVMMLTDRLGITVAEWILGGVGYAVWLLERTVQFEGMVEGGASK